MIDRCTHGVGGGLMGTGTWRPLVTAALGVVMLLSAAGTSVARQAMDESAPPPTVTPMTEAQVADQSLSVWFSRMAMSTIRSVREPQPGDFRIAAMLLEEATRLNPTDDELLRRLTEAYSAAGDEDAALETTERIVRLDPGDTVAQLRLISGRIRRLQSVDQRLAAFDRFLGPSGETVDASVRSRLALDAALLCREQGDVEKFANYLAKASSLDPTNKDAATLAVTFFTASVDDAKGRLELLLNLLKADPLDPATHLAIGRELAAAGAFRGADRFYKIWTGLLQVMQVEKDKSIPPEEFLVDWRLNGADQMVSKIWTHVENRRSALRAKAEYERSIGTAEEQVTNPEAETFTIQIARTVTIAASAIDDIERTRWALNELKRAVEHERKTLQMLTPPQNGPSPDVEGELLWARLWSGQQVDEAAADLETWRSLPGINPMALRRVEGWLAVRRGEFDKAIELLSGLPEGDIFGPLGLALVDELKGSKQSAAEGYTKIAMERPGTFPGAWAATRLERLSGKPVARTAMATSLESMIDAIPMWLEEMTRDPSRFMSMHAEMVPTGKTVFDRVRVLVRLRNLMPIPMGVGPDGPISSRMLITTPIEVGGQRVPAKDFVVVGAADRRLRLLPQDSFDTIIPVDSGRLGEGLVDLVGYSIRARFRVIQGFEAVTLNGQSTYQQGPLSMATETEPYARAMALISRMEPTRVENAIRAGGPIAAAEALAALRWRLATNPDEASPISAAQMADLVKAVAEKYPLVGRTQRGLWLFTLPSVRDGEMFAPVGQVIRAEPDPVLAGVVALARTTGPDDPLLAELEARNDPWLAKAVPLIRDFLKRRPAATPAPAAPEGATPGAVPTQGTAPGTAPGTKPAPATTPGSTPTPPPGPAPKPATPPGGGK